MTNVPGQAYTLCATLIKLLMYSDWESPVKPGKNKMIGPEYSFSELEPSLSLSNQSNPTSPPSDSFKICNHELIGLHISVP